MMTPQLFINYKMKSVAHMPWKTFVYKALNTFVDDLFAFIIRMPTLHRLACFRDGRYLSSSSPYLCQLRATRADLGCCWFWRTDIVFLIFLYQRWIYPVDKTRVNEFGQSGEDAHPQEVADAPAPAARAEDLTKKTN